MHAELWLALAWSFIAVKLLSTAIGLRMKRAGLLFNSRNGWIIYVLSKISPAVFCFALYKNAYLSHDALNARTYGWLTVFAVVLATVIAAQNLRRLVPVKSWRR